MTLLLKKTVLTVLSLILTGCAAFVPHGNMVKTVPFEDGFVRPLPADPQRATPAQLRSASQQFVSEYRSEAASSTGAVWLTKETTFAGVLMTVIGFSRPNHRIGLRNAGAGVAALSIAVEQFFKIDDFRDTFISAVSQGTCVAKRLSEIPDHADDYLAVFIKSATAAKGLGSKSAQEMKDLEDEVAAAGRTRESWRGEVYNAFTTIQDRIALAILKSQPVVPQVADFKTTFEKYRQAAPTPTQPKAVDSAAISAINIATTVTVGGLTVSSTGLSAIADPDVRSEVKAAIDSLAWQAVIAVTEIAQPGTILPKVNRMKELGADLDACTKF